jgi:transglutaminase-like putative cysteine protease
VLQQDFLAPGQFIDSDAPAVVAFARAATVGAGDPMEQALRLYRAVRDQVTYNPYCDITSSENFRASGVLAAGAGFCIGKAALLAACCRVVGVPARVGYADVKNHLTSPKLYEFMKSDIFVWHSYADLQLDGLWVKATPAFNLGMCERVGLKPLEFDGRSDSLFHDYDRAGRRHMEYLTDRGTFFDVPYDTIMTAFRAHYPVLMAQKGLSGDFSAEVVAEDA